MDVETSDIKTPPLKRVPKKETENGRKLVEGRKKGRKGLWAKEHDNSFPQTLTPSEEGRTVKKKKKKNAKEVEEPVGRRGGRRTEAGTRKWCMCVVVS
jgi:hypothetical protein